MKTVYEFEVESRYVWLSRRFPLPPPPLAEIYKEQKIRLGRGVDTPKLKSRGEPRKEEYFVHGTFPPFVPKKEGEKSNFMKINEKQPSKTGEDDYLCGYIFFNS